MSKPGNAERAELERQGAKAAVRGDPADDNPLLRTPNLPSRTGESQPLWEGRRDAWRQGYDHQQGRRVAPAATRQEPFDLDDLPRDSDVIQVVDSLAIPGFPLNRSG